MNGKSLTAEDWDGIDCLYDAFQLLLRKGILNTRLWRAFHCRCCRDIWKFITDTRSRVAVETAEKFLDHRVTIQALQRSFVDAATVTNEAWEDVMSLRIPGPSNVHEWPVSQAVDEAWIKFCAASAAKTCAENADDKVLFASAPDVSIRAWKDARPEVLGQNSIDKCDEDQVRTMVLRRWEEMRCEDEERLVKQLREFVEAANRRWLTNP